MEHCIRRGCKKASIVLLGLLISISAGLSAQDGYISARSFAESQGIAYQWFPIQKILVMRKGLKSVKLTVNEKTAIVDDVSVPMPAPALIQDGQIIVPATAMTRFFQVNSPAPLAQLPPPASPPIAPRSNLNQPVLTPIAQTPATINANTVADDAVLVALRHSSREDHTRVVLEFSDQITYRSEFKDGTYRLSIMGCRNLIPTQRTNPVGRDIAKLDINSGPDRKGLVLTFKTNQSKIQPTIETVNNPFRMIVAIAGPEIAPTATATEPITPALASAEALAAATPKKAVAPIIETAPEISIDVIAATLNNPAFAGRTIVIDAGHGGNDKGVVVSGRPDEKTITLSIARYLKTSLEKVGLKAVLTRNDDSDMTQQQRIAFANRNGGDLYISLHVGGSNDLGKAGFAVYTYSKKGTAVADNAQGLTTDAVYNEWLKNTRFDLSAFLAGKVSDRFNQHLKAENRGIKNLPILPLKFIMNPAIVVETGMLSDKTEGKNLLSENYRAAIAKSIANAVVDFFNGIVVNP